MTARNDIDTILGGWFLETAPADIPDGLHQDAIASLRRRRQRTGWSATVQAVTGRPLSRPVGRFAIILTAIALLIASLVVSALPAALRRNESPAIVAPTRPTQSSSVTTARLAEPSFEMPFTYAPPAGTTLARDASRLPNVIRWTNGSYSITVASVDPAWGHGNGRVFLSTDAEGFLNDLRDQLGIDIGPVTATTLDGRPAMTATSARSTTHLHLDSKIGGLVGPGDFEFDSPYRLITSDVEGSLILIAIGASTLDDVAGWMPTAKQLVDSIRFTPGAGQTLPRSSVVNLSRMSYRVPAGSGLEKTRSTPNLVTFTSPATGATSERRIDIGTAMTAWTYDRTNERTALGSSRDAFLRDLSFVGRIEFDDIRPAVIDGRSAVSVHKAADAPSGVHGFSVTGQWIGLGGTWLDTPGAYRLIVADVDGTTVFVRIGALTDAELSAWLPIAQQFLDSLDFDPI